MKSPGNIHQITLIFLLSFIPTAWNGFSCLSNPCVHGVCVDDLNSTYFCYCIDGYTGIECKTNWDECWSSPCQNGGICIDGIAMFNCSCPPGYLGDLCEEDFNECESNPCLNNGTCMDAPNGYSCNCLVGYSGTHCEIDVAVCNATNETRCSNGGICEEGPGESFTCRCQPGWGGFLCDLEIDECRSAPCQNGAICLDFHADYACACLFGFSGKNCEETVQICEKNPCKNGALCLVEDGHNTCYCVPDFHGELCQFQYDECQLGTRCKNGGTCIDGIDKITCSCPANLTGVLCECLILGENELDCEYVAPPTLPPVTNLPTITTSSTSVQTTTFVPNITSTTEIITTESTDETTLTSELTTLYPLITSETTTFDNTTQTLPQTTFEPTTIFSTILTETTPSTPTSTSMVTTEITSEIFLSTSTEPTITTLGINYTEPATITTSTEVSTSEITFTTTGVSPTTSREQREGSDMTFSTIFTTSSFFTEAPATFSTKIETVIPSTMSSIETSTMEEITTTTIASQDCALNGMSCQNGGTCVLTAKGHKCVCPFDTDGVFCEVTLGIRKAAFTGDSYISHRLLNFSHISFEFEAKTLSNSGLLFYSNIESTYLALYIENGYLKFKFSCGYQTMLLSELKVPVNTGYPMNIKAELEFSKDFKHCDAEIKLNKTLTMMGDQTANVDKFIHPTAWLHLGGIPREYHNENVPYSGFRGCISELKISGKTVNIFKDAEDGSQVTECSSLACLSNPCSNGGKCVAKAEEWTCKCKNGYLGKICEKSICDNNPCMFGGTCVQFTGSGYLCLCPYGKHGHFCENDMKISEPHFSPTIRGLSSYVAYPIPDGISRNMELSFKFTPTTFEQISLLLFIGQSGQHDYYSDHLAVSFVKGYIMLTWNLGSGPRRIFTSQPIQKGARDYLVRLGHLGRRAWLYVENLGNVTGRTPGNLLQLDVAPLLYLGGHFTQNFSTLPHDLPLHTGFSGCIFDVQLKSGSVVLPLQGSRQTLGRSVGQCGITECHEQSCQNNGACLHHGSTFMCLCQDNWYGPLCSSSGNLCDATSSKCEQGSTCVPLLTGYECDCPLGKTGGYCEKDEIITDVSLTGTRSYVALHPVEIDNAIFNIEMHLRILHDQGVVFYVGKSDSSFVCLSLQNGLLELRVQSSKNKILANTPLAIRNKKLLVKGIWHKIQFGLFGRKVFLSVDNIINTGLLNAEKSLSISKETIYLGGLPDLSTLPPSASPSFPNPFTGCMRFLTIDSNHIPLTPNNIRSSRNIVDCDGTPCGGDYCQNGGSCWLDSFMKSHCSCVAPFYGDKCEKIPVCKVEPCKNQGLCKDNTCSCKMGWNGAFCENDIIVKTPEFTGKSYLIVKNNVNESKKRNIRDVEIRKLYLNFTTAKPDGLLVWSKKDKSFIGIGIERGFLKLIYSLGKTNKKFIEIPSYVHVADGIWHNIEIAFGPFALQVDKTILETPNKQDKLIDNSIISTNGVFFIGGIPTNGSLLKETNGMFGKAFEGCIEGFGTNAEVIRDFRRFEGTNVDVCSIF